MNRKVGSGLEQKMQTKTSRVHLDKKGWNSILKIKSLNIYTPEQHRYDVMRNWHILLGLVQDYRKKPVFLTEAVTKRQHTA